MWAEDSSSAYSGSGCPLSHRHICCLPPGLKASSAFSCHPCREEPVWVTAPSTPAVLHKHLASVVLEDPDPTPVSSVLTLQPQALHGHSSPEQRGGLWNSHGKRDPICPSVTCVQSPLQLQTPSGQHQRGPAKKGHKMTE